MALVVALANRKGGQGKTSLAASLAAVSSSGALHTATVDADSQANLSRWALGRELVDRLGAANTVAALQFPPVGFVAQDVAAVRGVETREELVSAVLPLCGHASERVPGLTVIPTANHIHVEAAEELVLSRLPFDVVVVDTPPDISLPVVRSILRQADLVVSPVVCEPWAVDGTESLVREILSVGRRDLVDSGRVRFVVNMRQKCAVHDKLERAIRKQWGNLVSGVVLPRSIAVAEASISPAVLTKKHALYKAAVSLWNELRRVQEKRGAA